LELIVKGALDIHRTLLGLDIEHEIIVLPRVVLAADELPDVLGVDPEQCIQVKIFLADEQMVAVAVAAGREPEPEALLRTVRSQSVRPATAQEVNEATDYAAGLVAPLLLPPDVPLYVDARLGLHDVVYTATGESGTALGIPTAELMVTSRARVVDLSTLTPADIALNLAE
jgi:prolyl-tRNA editing enzyme YbaK/EbsC (Cys-tRNA(Pro) deacylase)